MRWLGSCIIIARLEDWRGTCIIPIYEDKGENNKCAYYRGVSLLTIPRKEYGIVTTEKAKTAQRTRGQWSWRR